LIGTPHYMSPEQATGRTDVGPSTCGIDCHGNSGSRVAYRGGFRFFLFAGFIPFYLITAWDRRMPNGRTVLLLVMLAGLAAMLALRHRVLKTLTSRYHMNVGDAVTVMNTPSWRVSAWRKMPAAALLGRTVPRVVAIPQPSNAETRLTPPVSAREDDATRLS
jgi:hypothetical protein